MYVFVYKIPLSACKCVLTCSPVQFAYCYPFTYTRLQQYLEGMEKLNLDYYKRELLCYSVVGALGPVYD